MILPNIELSIQFLKCLSVIYFFVEFIGAISFSRMQFSWMQFSRGHFSKFIIPNKVKKQKQVRLGYMAKSLKNQVNGYFLCGKKYLTFPSYSVKKSRWRVRVYS